MLYWSLSTIVDSKLLSDNPSQSNYVAQSMGFTLMAEFHSVVDSNQYFMQEIFSWLFTLTPSLHPTAATLVRLHPVEVAFSPPPVASPHSTLHYKPAAVKIGCFEEWYFDLYSIIEDQWLTLAYFYLDGEALEWYWWLHRNKQLVGCDYFTEKLLIHGSCSFIQATTDIKHRRLSTPLWRTF